MLVQRMFAGLLRAFRGRRYSLVASPPALGARKRGP